MAVDFNQIPASGIRVPFAYFELNSAGAPSGNGQITILLHGPILAGGTAVANQVYQVSSLAQAQALFGNNSPLAAMYQKTAANAPFATIYCAGEVIAGNAASQTLTINSVPTAPGVFVLYIGGTQVQAVVNNTMTTAQVATAVVNAINALPTPNQWTASAVANVVTISAQAKGTVYNGQPLALAPYPGQDQTAPTTSTLAGSTLAGGTGTPTGIAALQGNMGSALFDFIGTAFGDAASLSLWDTFMASRWGYNEQLYGQVWSAIRDTSANITTFGLARNGPDVVVVELMDVVNSLPSAVAAIVAVAATHLSAAPECSRPLTGLPIPGLTGAYNGIGQLPSVRNSFLYSGIATLTIDQGGTVYFDRAITTYQKTPLGVPDTSWMSANTKNQNRVALRYLRSYVADNYGRAALVDENPYNLENFVSASDVQTGLTHALNNLQAQGVVDNAAALSQYLVVERNATDSDRLDAYLPVDVVSQLNVFAGNLTNIN